MLFKAIDNNKMTEAKNEDEIPCKVILVGDSGVGKTSIIGRYLNRYSAEQRATIGASYSNKLEEIDNYKINFDIWDTAGQERFRSVNTIFYKEAYICIMVYDITKEESFQSIKEYWYNTVTENSLNKIIFGIAGNKIDLYEEEKVSQEEAKKFSDSIDAIYKTTSAKENTYIDDLFKDLGRKFINSNLFKQLLSEKEEERKSKVNLDEKSNKKNKKWC